MVSELNKKKNEDLSRYPYLKKFLTDSKRKYDLNSDMDCLELFNQILKISDKRKKEDLSVKI
jgi:hypothetical protein